MKSRFLLFSKLPDTQVATSARPKVSLARRFELQYNASPRFARRRQERRQGQALLLAVLIMLLAALLSAGVLAVVSGNLNQTARIADKTKAIEASRAGITYANAQLSGSSQGDLWRPIDVSPAPAPGSTNPDYNFYYSQLDKVQGWAATTPPARGDFAAGAAGDEAFRLAGQNYRDKTYGKFPDPNQNSGQSSGDAPKFLVKVTEIPLNLPNNNPEYEHRGEIKITSIGLSDDDPNVFHTSVAYKEGRKKSPFASALRSVSNWNFGDNDRNTGVPYANNPAITGTEPPVGSPPATPPGPPPGTFPAQQVRVAVDMNDKPQFSQNDVPFNIVIIKKDAATPANSTVRGAVVTKVTPPVNPGDPATLTLASLNATIGADETIQKAAAIGTGLNIDLLNTGTTTPPTIAATFPNYEQPNGILANGSLWLQNQVRLSNLSSKLTSDVTKVGTQLITSGALAIDDSASNISKKVVPSGDMAASPGGYDLVPSNVNYPGNNIVLTAGATSSGVEKTDLINDGWDKIGSVKTLGLEYTPSTPRTVEPFTPAKIDSATNLARYRALTRNADTVIYGGKTYKQGVYVDNREDIEKFDSREMTQAELIDMLISPTSTTPAVHARTGTAEAAGTVGKSLEQKHLRGWVGPDEFLARGALVEILPTAGPDGNAPSLRVTLDARSDSTTAAPNNDSGPVAAKAFRKEDGTLDTGVYSQVLPWPATGTLFAEGNLRIRGNVGTTVAAPRSLTVVSLGNIYVEGSLSVDNTTEVVDGNTVPNRNRKKLMLMAKKNVIVNPTRAVLARTDVQTVATNGTPITVTGTTGPGANLTLPVANMELFNQGDYVTVQGQTNVLRGLVKIPPVGNQLSIGTPDSGVVPIGNAIVRSPLEKRDVGTNASARAFFSLVDTENAINRRVVASLIADSIGNRNKITFDHVGELKQKTLTDTTPEGLLVRAVNFDEPTDPPVVPRPAGFTALLTNKQPVDASGDLFPDVRAVNAANRILRTTNNFPTPPTNQHSFTQDSNKTLTAFAAEIALTQASSLPATSEGYRYTATPTNPLFGALPSSALAGIGLRYAPRGYFDPAATSPAKNRPQDFNADAAVPSKFTIPLATSVEYDLNGASALFEPTVNSMLPAIRFIGFSPNNTSNDDALTVDSSFYQLKDNIIDSTIDARVLDRPVGTGLPLSLPQSIVLKRSAQVNTTAISDLLPDYQVRSMRLENINLRIVGAERKAIKPAAGDMQINAFVYAQEGSWLVIPGDYFRSDFPSNPQIRGEKNAGNELAGSYIDYNDNNTADAPVAGQPTEYVVDTSETPNPKVADLNRNGIADPGEKEAALRFVRYNTAPIKFYGAIVENQTAVVADIADATVGNPPIIKGAVQDWMDKWAAYADTGSSGGGVGLPNKFSFITYAYDPTLANGNAGANQLRVPVTDELLYQQ